MISDIALLVSSLGVLCVGLGLRQSYRERLRQFESLYIQRYWKILDQLTLDAVKGLDPESINQEDEQAIRSYLRLCEDELEMRGNGYIADNTYQLWSDGMLNQIENPQFRKIWLQVQEEASNLGQPPYKYLSNLEQRGPDDGDPLKASDLWRWIRGLKGLTGV